METGELLNGLVSEGQGLVLATVVSVCGHAYRKEGAAMLLRADGAGFGSISPGCMEADLLARVPDILSSGVPQTAVYDMSGNDPVWGASVGCGGSVTVLLEPVEDNLRAVLLHVRELLEGGAAVSLVRRWNEAGGIVYTVRCGETAPQADAEYPAPSPDGKAGVRTFVWTVEPQPRLILFGAGNDAIPVARLAERSGFRVTAADWREGLCTEQRFPSAIRVIGTVDEIAGRIGWTHRDYAVVMSHQLERDRALLEQLVKVKLRYVGIMGSATRLSRLLEGLEVPEWFRYPVGLSIGAQGPEEIAVSIVAELIAVRRKAQAEGKRGASIDEDSRNRAGGREGQPDGRIQTRHGAPARNAARQLCPPGGYEFQAGSNHRRS